MLQFVDEVVKLDGSLKHDFHQHGIITGDTITFNHIGNSIDERVEFLFLCRFHLKINESLNVIAKEHGIYSGMIAG